MHCYESLPGLLLRIKKCVELAGGRAGSIELSGGPFVFCGPWLFCAGLFVSGASYIGSSRWLCRIKKCGDLRCFVLKKYVGPARGPARLLLSVHLEGVHRLLLLCCAFPPVPRIKKCAGLIERSNCCPALKNAPGPPALGQARVA